jgi:hypothetical protein
VIADLRILEEHKVESQRLLDSARLSRLQRVQIQSDLESQLDAMKYRNGQMRTEETHHHELLANGQRILSSAMVSSANATKNLDEFDERLKVFHSTKKFLAYHQRRQEQIIEYLRQKLMKISMVLSNDENDLASESREATLLQSDEHSLQKSINHVLVSQKRFEDSVLGSQNELYILLQSLTDVKTHETDTSTKLKEAQKLKMETSKRADEAANARRTSTSELMTMQRHKAKANVNLNDKIATEQLVLDNLISIASKSVFVDIDNSFNLSRLRESLQSDLYTITLQEKILLNLRESLTKDRESLKQQLEEAKVTHERLNVLTECVLKETTIEEKREKSFEQVQKQLGEVKVLVNSRHYEIDERKKIQRDAEYDKQVIAVTLQDLAEKKSKLNEKCESLAKENEVKYLSIQKIRKEEEAYISLIGKHESDDSIYIGTLRNEIATLEFRLLEIQKANGSEKQHNHNNAVVSIRNQMSKLILGTYDGSFYFF